MKDLYLIGGTMGVGKTATSQCLKRLLPGSVFLDGDWCWDMDPFLVTDETKQMVIKNIAFLLNSFLDCSIYKNVIFCWVMHEQAIIDEILSLVDVSKCRVHRISLVSTRDALIERLEDDIATGIRSKDVLERSLERLPLYDALGTDKLDVSNMTPQEAAKTIEKQF